MKWIWKALRGYFGDFRQLLRLPKEFWAIQALNLVYCLVYFAFVTVNSLHLSQDVGFSDEAAGLLVGMFLTGTAILQIFMGPILDRIGFRRTPLIAATIVAVGFVGIGVAPLALGVTTAARAAVVVFYVIAMIGNGLMFPILTAGTKRYCNKTTQNAAFNFWYLSMQAGAILLFLIDYVRRPVNAADPTALAAFRAAGGNAHLFWWLAGLSVICLLVVFFLLKKEEQFPEFGAIPAPKQEASQKSVWRHLKEVFANRAFHKALAVLALTIPAHIPFVLVFVMYPKYWTRVVGPNVPIGQLEMINPLIIMFALVLLAPLMKRFNVYWVLLAGMVITSFSMLILAVPPQWIAGMADITLPSAYLVLIYAQVCIFAVGEAIWSPQLQSYVATFTPEGSEGTFMGISRFPHTTAKLLASAVAGFLLAHFCPEGVMEKIEAGMLGYTHGPEMMNIIMAAACLISPLGLLIFKSRLYVAKKAE